MTEIRKRGITVTDQTPATETGRQLALEWMLHGTEDDRDAFVADILAIEAEARADVLGTIEHDPLHEHLTDVAYAKGRADALREAADAVRALTFPYAPDSGHSAGYENGWYDGRGAASRAILDAQP